MFKCHVGRYCLLYRRDKTYERKSDIYICPSSKDAERDLDKERQKKKNNDENIMC